MKITTIIGIVLVIAGVIGFVAGGIPFKTSEQVVDLGPVEVQAEEKHAFPATPLASGVALLGGAILVYAGRRQGGD